MKVQGKASLKGLLTAHEKGVTRVQKKALLKALQIVTHLRDAMKAVQMEDQTDMQMKRDETILVLME